MIITAVAPVIRLQRFDARDNGPRRFSTPYQGAPAQASSRPVQGPRGVTTHLPLHERGTLVDVIC